MKLNKPGIYRVVGEKFELLINVVGEAPILRITGALLINELISKGEFKVLTEESFEVQSVNANPDNFIFIEYDYSDVCKLPPYRQSIRGIKMPDITDNKFTEYTDRYLSDIRIPGRGIEATKAYIMRDTEWTLPQINVVMLQIINKLKRHGRLLSY